MNRVEWIELSIIDRVGTESYDWVRLIDVLLLCWLVLIEISIGHSIPSTAFFADPYNLKAPLSSPSFLFSVMEWVEWVSHSRFRWAILWSLDWRRYVDFVPKVYVEQSHEFVFAEERKKRPNHVTRKAPHATTEEFIFIESHHHRKRKLNQNGKETKWKERSKGFQDQVFSVPHCRGRRCSQAGTQSLRILWTSVWSGFWILLFHR